jgi:hypothetical protein
MSLLPSATGATGVKTCKFDDDDDEEVEDEDGDDDEDDEAVCCARSTSKACSSGFSQSAVVGLSGK